MTINELFDTISTDKAQILLNIIETIKEPYEKTITDLTEENKRLKEALNAYRKTGYEPWEFGLIKHYREKCEKLEKDCNSLINRIDTLQRRQAVNKYNKSFLNSLILGEVLVEEIDDYVEYWHTHNTKCSLPTFLGMSDSLYSKWATEGNKVLIEFVEEERKRYG